MNLESKLRKIMRGTARQIMPYAIGAATLLSACEKNDVPFNERWRAANGMDQKNPAYIQNSENKNSLGDQQADIVQIYDEANHLQGKSNPNQRRVIAQMTLEKKREWIEGLISQGYTMEEIVERYNIRTFEEVKKQKARQPQNPVSMIQEQEAAIRQGLENEGINPDEEFRRLGINTNQNNYNAEKQYQEETKKPQTRNSETYNANSQGVLERIGTLARKIGGEVTNKDAQLAKGGVMTRANPDENVLTRIVKNYPQNLEYLAKDLSEELIPPTNVIVGTSPHILGETQAHREFIRDFSLTDEEREALEQKTLGEEDLPEQEKGMLDLRTTILYGKYSKDDRSQERNFTHYFSMTFSRGLSEKYAENLAISKMSELDPSIVIRGKDGNIVQISLGIYSGREGVEQSMETLDILMNYLERVSEIDGTSVRIGGCIEAVPNRNELIGNLGDYGPFGRPLRVSGLGEINVEELLSHYKYKRGETRKMIEDTELVFGRRTKTSEDEERAIINLARFSGTLLDERSYPKDDANFVRDYLQELAEEYPLAYLVKGVEIYVGQEN